MAATNDQFYYRVEQLSPKSDLQRTLKSLAVSTAADLGMLRWQLYGQSGGSVTGPFVVAVILWTAAIFLSFGLLSPRNLTVATALLLCALSVAGALFLILELDRPFDGYIHISSAPMLTALEHLGK
jgi:hypothetical protein